MSVLRSRGSIRTKKGFTLIELLAVIVILAIIALITTPTINGLIENSRKEAFKDDAISVLRAIDYKKFENSTFDQTKLNEGNITELLSLPNNNYETVTVIFNEGVRIIIIKGKGEWDNLFACGDYTNIKVANNITDCGGDLMPPVITMNGDETITIVRGSSYTDSGATAIDDVDGDITSGVTVTNTVNPNAAGIYTVTYNATDSSGNVASQVVRTVKVKMQVLQVASGIEYTLYLMEDGTVRGVGQNANGELGDGTTINKTLPVQVKGVGGAGYLTDVKEIFAGMNFSLALKNDGTLYAWGLNTDGQLGDGTTTTSLYPVQVKGASGVGYLTDVKSAAAGITHSMAIKTDGTLWSWGDNAYGQLGDNTKILKTSPTPVYDPTDGQFTNVKNISAGLSNSYAVKNDGTVWGWGRETGGNLGLGNLKGFYLTPQSVSASSIMNGKNIIKNCIDRFHALNLQDNGDFYGNGRNSESQLGDGTTTGYSYPNLGLTSGIAAGEKLVDIRVGDLYSAGLSDNGTLYTWGNNTFGQLGDGTNVGKTSPTNTNISGVKQISSGYYHLVLLMNDGTVKAVGKNLNGQLGDGTTTNTSTPVDVSINVFE